MNASEPTLFRLFRRSGYRTPQISEDNNETDEENDARSERERFAAAAVGFVLKHSPEFRMHFWKRICRADADPSIMPALSIALEPPRWADLRLIGQASHRRTIWVVEFKLDSDLAKKQNPTVPDSFCEPGTGYGALFRSSEASRKADLRYVVLGSRTLPEGHGEIGSLKIHWHARRWGDLREDAPLKDSLTADLFHTLGNLGLPTFRMNATKSITVAGSFDSAANAWQVLNALGGEDVCKFPARSWRIRAETPEEGHFNVGAYLTCPRESEKTSGLYRDLVEQIGGNAERIILWAGYESGQKVEGFRRSVWCYFRKKTVALLARMRLRNVATVGDLSIDAGALCLVATNLANSKEKDLDWFKNVLRAVGTSKAKR